MYDHIAHLYNLRTILYINESSILHKSDKIITNIQYRFHPLPLRKIPHSRYTILNNSHTQQKHNGMHGTCWSTAGIIIHFQNKAENLWVGTICPPIFPAHLLLSQNSKTPPSFVVN